VRRYDADRLARYPEQKVRGDEAVGEGRSPGRQEDSRLFIPAWCKIPASATSIRAGDCIHAIAEDQGHEIRFACAVDREGGGIDVALSKDDKSAIVRLERIRIWLNNKPTTTPRKRRLPARTRSRLDRADTGECAFLVTDRKELAAIRHK